MKDEVIDRLFTAADQAFKPLGYDGFEQVAGEVAEFFTAIAERMSVMRDREAMRRSLRESPEPEATEFEQAIRTLPDLIYIIRRLAPEVAKRIPHPPGGRPEAFKLQEERQNLCSEIGALYAKGVPLGTAFQRMAQRHGVSLRTIQRVWANRKQSHPPG